MTGEVMIEARGQGSETLNQHLALTGGSMKTWKTIVRTIGASSTAVIVIAWAGSLEASLVSFSFTGAAGNEAVFAADDQPAGANVSAMSRGGGINPTANANTFSASQWTTSATRDLTEFFAFSITPDFDQILTLTSLELDERRSGTGIRQWSVYSSLDGFSGDLATFLVPDNDATRLGQVVNLGAPFSSLVGPVEFRIYGFEAEGSAGTWRIDNVNLFGLLAPRSTAVPDAGSSLAMLGLALGGLGWTVRRFAR